MKPRQGYRQKNLHFGNLTREGAFTREGQLGLGITGGCFRATALALPFSAPAANIERHSGARSTQLIGEGAIIDGSGYDHSPDG